MWVSILVQQFRDKFYFLGNDVTVEDNVDIALVNKTHIGNKVTIRQYSCLVGNAFGNRNQQLRIKIGDRSYIGRYTILESFNQVIIDEDVLIGPRVYISDSQHEYSNPNIPIDLQYFQSDNNTVTIQRGAWVGAGATIVGDLTVGYGSVIGANSVVTSDVPSHCVVIGNPAMVLKIYHYKKKEWIKPSSDEEFLEICKERGDFLGYDNQYILESLKKQIEEGKIKLLDQ